MTAVDPRPYGGVEYRRPPFLPFKAIYRRGPYGIRLRHTIWYAPDLSAAATEVAARLAQVYPGSELIQVYEVPDDLPRRSRA